MITRLALPDRFPSLLPRWQIALVLVGFPSLYMLNSFAPWSRALFGGGDRSNFFPFFISILTLHWISVGTVVYLIHRAGLSLRDLDLTISARTATKIAARLIAVGAAFVLFRELVPYSVRLPRALAFFPRGPAEGSFFILVALSAGFCEEFVYRGFGISVLQWRGMRLWQAVTLATFAFVFMHGPAGVFAFPVFFLAGLLYAGIYLGRVGGIGPRGLVRPSRKRNLLPPMVIHAIGDMMAILAP